MQKASLIRHSNFFISALCISILSLCVVLPLPLIFQILKSEMRTLARGRGGQTGIRGQPSTPQGEGCWQWLSPSPSSKVYITLILIAFNPLCTLISINLHPHKISPYTVAHTACAAHSRHLLFPLGCPVTDFMWFPRLGFLATLAICLLHLYNICCHPKAVPFKEGLCYHPLPVSPQLHIIFWGVRGISLYKEQHITGCYLPICNKIIITLHHTITNLKKKKVRKYSTAHQTKKAKLHL